MFLHRGGGRDVYRVRVYRPSRKSAGEGKEFEGQRTGSLQKHHERRVAPTAVGWTLRELGYFFPFFPFVRTKSSPSMAW